MVQVTWTEPALADLEDIRRHIARAAPGIADAFVDRLVDASARLEALPLSGRTVPEVGRNEIREVISLGYRLIYSVLAHEVEVLAVIHGARLLSPEDLSVGFVQ